MGVDASADQLHLASQQAGRVATLVQSVSAFTPTDVEDLTVLAAEARRVLEPDGRFVYVLHPCFIEGSALE